MIDGRHLRLISSVFKETTIVEFYTKDSKRHWRLVFYKMLGPPPKPVFMYF